MPADDLTEVGTNTPRFTYGKYDREYCLNDMSEIIL